MRDSKDRQDDSDSNGRQAGEGQAIIPFIAFPQDLWAEVRGKLILAAV
jgi:hypothetical protein